MIKNYTLVFLIFCLGITSLKSLYAKDFILKREYMPLSEVKKRWGQKTFQTHLFKSNKDPIFRAKMAYDLINKKLYIGKPKNQVIKDLGSPTGFFFNDMVPSYLIGKGRTQINGHFTGETWQIVFMLTRDGQKVASVKIHKQCCYQYDKKVLKELEF